ncbi:MAG: hypothetical protein ABIQ86_04230 [Steroidobacteraceae bacterium]
MSAPFEVLEDRLLRGGIAPRHVKRYLSELNEHLSDITEAQAAAGHEAPTAAARARAALGPDDELADAMLKQRDFRSVSARFPWIVFGVLPVLVLSLAVPWHILVLVVLKKLSAPTLFPTLEEMVLFTGNFILVPTIGLLSVFIARRQRHLLVWPILSTAIILILSPHWDNQRVANFAPGFSALYHMYRYSDETIRSGITPIFLSAWWHLMAVQWATLAAQYLLTLLPLAWLVHRHRKTGAIA